MFQIPLGELYMCYSVGQDQSPANSQELHPITNRDLQWPFPQANTGKYRYPLACIRLRYKNLTVWEKKNIISHGHSVTGIKSKSKLHKVYQVTDHNIALTCAAYEHGSLTM